MARLYKKREYKYDVIRIILTLLVVIGHANYYNAGNAYGGIYILDRMTEMGIADTMIHKIAEQLKLFIYTFHMPAFFALSGAIFYMQLNQGKISSLKKLVHNKASRLLIPFVIVYLFWNTPIKLISGYYSSSISLWKDILMQMLIPTNMYLWYLEALFIDFILAYLLCKILPKLCQVNAATVCIYLLDRCIYVYTRAATLTMIFGNPMRYLLWFVIGMNIERIVVVLKNQLTLLRKFGLEGGILFLLTVWIIGDYSLDYLPHLVWLIKGVYMGFVGILIIWLIGELIAEKLSEIGKQVVVNISEYTFGIYLYSEPLNYLIIVLFAESIGLDFFGLEWGALVIWFVRVIGTIIVAVLVTKLLKKANLKLTLY